MMAAPRYFASPENRWEELYFDDLPNWMLPLDTPGVVDGFYQGIWSGVPWGAWLGPIFWAGSIALAITASWIGINRIISKAMGATRAPGLSPGRSIPGTHRRI